jgi:photosystem II stability/assembly factor-like uncharacterized protein
MIKLYTLLIFSFFFFTQKANSQYFFWEQIYTPGNNGLYDIAVDSSGSIYICVPSSSSEAGIHRSDDNGITWVKKNNGLVVSNPKIVSLCWNNVCLLAGSGAKIYQSFDKGENWDTVFYSSSGGNFVKLEAGFDSIVLAGSAYYDGIMRSGDYGNTWKRVLDLFNVNWIEWVTGFVYSPNGVIYASTAKQLSSDPGNIYQSFDYGNTWSVFSSAPSPNSIGLDNQGRLLRGEFGDGLYRLDWESNEWEHIVNNFSTPQGILTVPDNRIFLCMNYWPNYMTSGVMMSVDDGENYEYVNNNINTPIDLLNFEVDKVGRVLVGGAQLYRSWDTLFTKQEKPEITKSEFRIFPNPCKDYLKVEIPGQNMDINLNEPIIERIDGQKCKLDYLMIDNNIKFNTKHLKPGTYLLKIRCPHFSNTYKFIHY